MFLKLHEILHISKDSIFCIIDEKNVFITNCAITEIAKRKDIKIDSAVEDLTYEDRIILCENNFNLNDLFEQRKGIIFYGEKHDI